MPNDMFKNKWKENRKRVNQELREADISVAKNEISDLGTESQNTKQELKLQLFDVKKLKWKDLSTGQSKTGRTSRPKQEPILQGNSRRNDHERIRTGERSHRQPPEIVRTNRGECLCQIHKKLVTKSYREFITHLNKGLVSPGLRYNMHWNCMDRPRRMFVSDLQETVAVTVEQYYRTRAKPRHVTGRFLTSIPNTR